MISFGYILFTVIENLGNTYKTSTHDIALLAESLGTNWNAERFH